MRRIAALTAMGLPTLVVLSGCGSDPVQTRAAVNPCVAAELRASSIWDDLNIPLPSGWSIHYSCGGDRYVGWASYDYETITVWPQLYSNMSDTDFEYFYYHEAIHAWDDRLLNANNRFVWMAVRELNGEWFGEPTDGFTPPSEDFAEAGAACLVGVVNFTYDHVEPPSELECRLIANMIPPMFEENLWAVPEG